MRAALLALLLLVPLAQAAPVCPPEDCIPIVGFVEVPYVSGAVTFERFAADVQVRDAIAVTRIQVGVANPGATATEATVSLPLPDGAAVLAFNLTIGERVIHGQVKERSQAQAEYREAVEQGKDAALLEQADKRQVVLRLNVGPGEDRVLQAAYAESIPLVGGSRVYRLPLSQLDPLPDALHIGVEVASRLGAHNLTVHGWPIPLASGRGVLDIAPTQAADVVVTWKEESGRRSSLLAAGPGPGARLATLCLDGDVLSRDVAFIIDQSGSMSGLKMEEAREALQASLATLATTDFFTVVPFSYEDAPLHAGLVPASTARIQKAQDDVAKLEAGGGTNIDAALQEAFRQLGAAPASTRLPMVVFLTDGLPSSGITDHEEIIQRARAANTRDAPIIVVPIGLDADYTFLATLALRSGGSYVDVGRPDALLSDRLERLAQVLAGPVAANGALAIDQVVDGSVLPRVLPPVYAEDCLEVRFQTDTDGPITLSYLARGRDGLVTHSQSFTPDDVLIQPAVANLWAQWHVAELLADEREEASDALRQAIIANATSYGLLTPYTAWVLVDEAEAPAPAADAHRLAGSAAGTMSSASTSYTSGTATGQQDAAKSSAASKTPGAPLGLLALLLMALVTRRRRQG